MKSSLLMDFLVDKENAKVIAKREFAASLKHVWAAWTQPELLDQWWAPSPYVAKTRSLDLREGGTWLYSMVGPEGDEHFCRADYTAIQQLQSLGWLDAFTNPEGEINKDFPRSDWNIHFSENGETSLVHVEIKHQSLADLEMIIKMGFKEGFTMALGNLDELLEKN